MKPITLYGSLFILLLGCSDSAETNTDEALNQEDIWTIEDRNFILAELDRTTDLLIEQTRDLAPQQADYKLNETNWTITEIIEHLEVQNELHFREIRAISKTPQLLKYVAIVKDNDSYFEQYATDTTKGKAQWFLEPIGRFANKDQALAAFIRTRSYLRQYVQETDIDLRKHFTFRRNIEYLADDQIEMGDVRDLHQLLLTGIAHTDRHIDQIKRISESFDFPNE